MPGRGDASTKDTVTALTTNIERKRPGRPPGTSDTRERILDSARNLFARNGIDKTSIRAIAKDAGVDPALVHHYFGTKTQLFAAAIHIPIDPMPVIGPLREVPVEQIGYVLPSILLPLWDSEMGKGFIATLRSILAGNEVSLDSLVSPRSHRRRSRVARRQSAGQRTQSACSSSRRSWWAS